MEQNMMSIEKSLLENSIVLVEKKRGPYNGLSSTL